VHVGAGKLVVEPECPLGVGHSQVVAAAQVLEVGALAAREGGGGLGVDGGVEVDQSTVVKAGLDKHGGPAAPLGGGARLPLRPGLLHERADLGGGQDVGELLLWRRLAGHDADQLAAVVEQRPAGLAFANVGLHQYHRGIGAVRRLAQVRIAGLANPAAVVQPEHVGPRRVADGVDRFARRGHVCRPPQLCHVVRQRRNFEQGEVAPGIGRQDTRHSPALAVDPLVADDTPVFVNRKRDVHLLLPADELRRRQKKPALAIHDPGRGPELGIRPLNECDGVNRPAIDLAARRGFNDGRT